MRIALAYPASKRLFQGCYPPLSLLYLATSLLKNDFETAVFDPDGYRKGVQELARDLVKYNPDLIGISVLTDTSYFRNIRFLCKYFRDKMPNARILLGGVHATILPEQMFDWFPEIDFVLRGEADITLCTLAKQLKANASVANVPGLCFMSQGKIAMLPINDYIKNLDDLPIPDRRLLWNNYKRGVYYRIEHRGATDIMITSRGCPSNCRFCSKMSKGYRQRSAESIIKEMEYLSSLGIKSIHIEDNLFVADKKRVMEVCRLIKKLGLRLNLKVRSRVDTIDRQMFEELRSAGVTSVVYGIESGSQKVLDAMGKKTSVKQNYEAIRLAKEAGLRCYADMLCGFPGETPETLIETQTFLLKTRPFFAAIGALIPIPGTPVYEEAKANGTLRRDWSIDGPTPYVCLSAFRSHAELLKRIHSVDKRFYLNHRVILGYVLFLVENLTNKHLYLAAIHKCLNICKGLQMNQGVSLIE